MWEEDDRMDPEQFDPKAFFMLHGMDGYGCAENYFYCLPFVYVFVQIGGGLIFLLKYQY